LNAPLAAQSSAASATATIATVMRIITAIAVAKTNKVYKKSVLKRTDFLVMLFDKLVVDQLSQNISFILV